MLTPFIYSLPSLVFYTKRKRKRLGNVLIHLPLVIPLKNLFHAWDLYKVEYQDEMPIASLSMIESIQSVAGSLTLREAFMVNNND